MTATTEANVPAPKRRYSLWTNPFIEAFAMIAWFFTTCFRYNHDTEVLYVLSGYFLVGCILHGDKVWPILQRGWPVLLLPPWVMLSTAWSAVPFETFKYSLQGVLSVLICIYVAARIPMRTFIAGLIVALTYYEILSIPHLKDVYFTGAFNEKNFFAYRMSILTFGALTVLFDKQFPRYMRIAAGPIAALAIFMIWRAHSATSFVVGLFGALIIMGGVLLWKPARGYRMLIVCVAIAALAGAAMYIMRDPNFNFETWALGLVNKDSTLTGRQELWDYAGKLIAQKPMLGMGMGSFWLPDRPDAQMLLDTHFKPRGTQFIFHNSYVELTVYAGYIGLGAGLVGMIWAMSRNILRFISQSSSTTAFFATVSVVALVRTYVESDMWQPFDYAMMIIWIGALYPWRLDQGAGRRLVREAEEAPAAAGGAS
jgi:exopolysaccharide production protein ExoQ